MAHDPFLAGQVPSANKLEVLSKVNSYTPAVTATTTNPALGADGFALGDHHRNGHMVEVWVRILFSGTGFSYGTGNYEITLPFPADSSLGSIIGSTTVGSGTSIGSGIIVPQSSGTARNVQVFLRSGVNGLVRLIVDSTTSALASGFFTATGGRITFHCQYPADPASLP